MMGMGCECDGALWSIICEKIVCSSGYHLNSALFFKELTDRPDTVFLYTQEILKHGTSCCVTSAVFRIEYLHIAYCAVYHFKQYVKKCGVCNNKYFKE